MKPSTKVKIAAAGAAVALVASLAVGVPLLARWLRSKESGLATHTSDHFEVHASDPASAADIAARAEAFVAAMVQRHGSRGMRLPRDPVAIYVFPDDASFQAHARFKVGSALEHSGGYFGRAERTIALIRGDREALHHELTHLLASDAWGDASLSPWFSEGQAQWHERGPEGGRPQIALALLMLGAVGEAVYEVKLANILALDNCAFATEGNAFIYCISALLYTWLAEERPEALARVETLEREPGVPGTEEFAAAVGEPLEAVEAAWHAWMRKTLTDSR